MLTPVDLETTVFRRGLRGYKTTEVQDFMDQITRDYEHVYRENIDLKEKLEDLTTKLNQYKTIEDTLRNTMILAESTATDAKNTAKQQAELIIRQAEIQAETLKVKLKEDIQVEIRNLALLKNQTEYFKCQFKSFLSGLLEMAEKQLDLNVVWESSSQKETSSVREASSSKEASSGAATQNSVTLEKETKPKEEAKENSISLKAKVDDIFGN